MSLFVGIDPGTSGAVGIIGDDGQFFAAFDLPDPKRLWEKLSVHREPLTDIRVVLEEPFAMPGQSSVTTAKQWRGVGRIEGVLTCTGLAVTTVRADVWKRQMRLNLTKEERVNEAGEQLDKNALTAARKRKSLGMARCLWADAPLSRQKDEGRAEALLLAEWGRRKERGRLL